MLIATTEAISRHFSHKSKPVSLKYCCSATESSIRVRVHLNDLFISLKTLTKYHYYSMDFIVCIHPYDQSVNQPNMFHVNC